MNSHKSAHQVEHSLWFSFYETNFEGFHFRWLIINGIDAVFPEKKSQKSSKKRTIFFQTIDANFDVLMLFRTFEFRRPSSSLLDHPMSYTTVYFESFSWTVHFGLDSFLEFLPKLIIFSTSTFVIFVKTCLDLGFLVF